MDATALCYLTGEEIHAGDRVQHRGNYATVVFVSNGDSEEFAPGYEDYVGSDPGIILCDDDGGINHLGHPDEDLALIDRG